MTIGIVVHSQSGHTANLARAVAVGLRERGHDVDVKLLRPRACLWPFSRSVSFLRLPDIDPEKLDVLLVGGPVWGFAAAPPILAYIDTLPNMRGRKVMGFVTHGLPLRMSGARGLAHIDRALVLCGGIVLDGVAVFHPPWSSPERIEKGAAQIRERIEGMGST
jgi:hypothetical protein